MLKFGSLLYRSLRKKCKTLHRTVTKNHKVSADWIQKLTNVKSLDDLDILAEPYKPENKKSLANKAREAGLEEAALEILENNFDVQLTSYINADRKGTKDLAEVKKGVQAIIVSVIAHDVEVRKFVEKNADTAILESSKARETQAAKEKKRQEKVEDFKYETYFKFSCPVKTLKAHQTLAINRGEKNKVLSVKITFPEWFKRSFRTFCFKKFVEKGSKRSHRTSFLVGVIEESFTKTGKSYVHNEFYFLNKEHLSKRISTTFLSDYFSLSYI